MTNEEIRIKCQALSTRTLAKLVQHGALGPRGQQIAEEVLATRQEA